MAREIVLEEDACKFAEERGWMQRKTIYAGRRGCPDRMFWRNGVFLMVEFKKKGGKPEAHQEREHARFKAQGFTVHVIDNFEDAKALLA